jgi:transcriptional regulator with XRE-family HTH domain
MNTLLRAGPRRRERGEAERRLAAGLPTVVREIRRALRLTQATLARRCGLSQPQLSSFEGGDLTRLNVEELGRALDALGIRLDLGLRRPYVAAPPFQQDAAHARALAYVAGRLRAMGWDVRLEVEIA